MTARLARTAPASAADAPERRSRADDVYDRIKADIGRFVLVPGDRFTEGETCERLGVSRTPVRQALVRLQQEGHVQGLFRNGWRVSPFDFVKFEQLYDLRMTIETTATQRLCTGATVCGSQADRTRLEALSGRWLAKPSARSKDGERVSEWDEDFHCALVEAAGNAEMARVHRDVTERIRVVRRLDFTQPRRIEATYEEHAQILKAILAKRSDQACLLLRAHIGSSQAEVRKITLHQVHLARDRGPG